MSEYSWGVDGYGRAHICKSDNVIILSMISGNCGKTGALILEEQDQIEKIQRTAKSNILQTA